MHSYFVEQDAAVSDGRLPDLRRRGRVDVQRGAADPLHAEGRSRDPTTRLSLLGNYLENVKGTVFRQTQFAEFELRIHEMAEQGEPLTGETLVEALSGDRAQVLRPRQKRLPGRRLRAHEWAFIPHFYYDVLRLPVRDVVHGVGGALGESAVGRSGGAKRYLEFLSRRRIQYPIELLKDAGVDMTTGEPLELTMQKMNRVMDEMEKLIK